MLRRQMMASHQSSPLAPLALSLASLRCPARRIVSLLGPARPSAPPWHESKASASARALAGMEQALPRARRAAAGRWCTSSRRRHGPLLSPLPLLRFGNCLVRA
jgi:hypothetical protein